MRGSGGNVNERTGRYFEFLGFFGDCSCLGLEDGMSDIQDEAYTEACEEIERLKAQLEKGRLANEQEANRKLLALLTRAADALEDCLPMKRYAAVFKLPYYDLIAELRKAAG